MRLFTIGILCLLLSSCTLEFSAPDPQGPVYFPEQEVAYVEVSYYETYGCWDQPYYWSPEWCDWYDDDTTCCVWLVDGWYEEWCQWGSDWCWEYNAAW